MVTNVQGSVNVHALGQTGGIDNNQVQEQTGGRSIGEKIASFFSAVGQAIAAPFRAIGNAIQSLFAHDANVGGGVTARGSTFTTQEKQQLLEEAFESSFYKEVCKGGPVSIEQFEGSARAILETPSSVEAMKKYGVTLAEAVAISCYSSQSYVAINGELRSNNPHPAATELAEAFRSGLEKLPSFEGTVYRGARLPANVGLTYQEGNVVRDQGIISTTWDPHEKFTDRINYDIQIVCKDGSQGKDISMFSDKPTECEVAFPPGVQFHVTNRTIDGREDASQEMHQKHPQDMMGERPMWCMNIVMEEI